MADDNTAFMIGDDSTLLRYSRDPRTGSETWQLMRHVHRIPLYRIWGNDPCDVWAAGNAVMHYRCGANGAAGTWEVINALAGPEAVMSQIWGPSGG